MRRTMIGIGLALAALLTASRAQADLAARVESDIAASVTFDGEQVGTTPLALSGILPGDHTLLVKNPATQEAKTFVITSPRNIHVDRTITATFGAAPAPVAATPEPPPVQKTIVHHVYRNVYSYPSYSYVSYGWPYYRPWYYSSCYRPYGFSAFFRRRGFSLGFCF